MSCKRRPTKRQLLTDLIHEVKTMSTTLANLQQADQALADAIATNVQDTGKIIAELKDLADQVAALKANSLDPTAVDAVASDIQAKVAALQQNNASLEATFPAPAPDPVPTDGSTGTV